MALKEQKQMSSTKGSGVVQKDQEWYQKDQEWYHRKRSGTTGKGVIPKVQEWYQKSMSGTKGAGVVPKEQERRYKRIRSGRVV